MGISRIIASSDLSIRIHRASARPHLYVALHVLTSQSDFSLFSILVYLDCIETEMMVRREELLRGSEEASYRVHREAHLTSDNLEFVSTQRGIVFQNFTPKVISLSFMCGKILAVQLCMVEIS